MVDEEMGGSNQHGQGRARKMKGGSKSEWVDGQVGVWVSRCRWLGGRVGEQVGRWLGGRERLERRGKGGQRGRRLTWSGVRALSRNPGKVRRMGRQQSWGPRDPLTAQLPHACLGA